MGVRFIPSVLAYTPDQFRRRLRIAKGLSRRLHLDVMDGEMTPRRTSSYASMARLAPRGVDVHAMVTRLDHLRPFVLTLRPRIVYLHVELGEQLDPFINWAKQHRIQVGLAINPQTPVTAVRRFEGLIHSLLVLGVRPGRYGAPFVAETPRRVAYFRRRYPRWVISCDGHADQRTIRLLVSAGAQEIVVGSAVILAARPTERWREIRRLT